LWRRTTSGWLAAIREPAIAEGANAVRPTVAATSATANAERLRHQPEAFQTRSTTAITR
jgi:hypothetical protein